MTSVLQRIPIAVYTAAGRFAAFPAELVAFAATEKLPLPELSTQMGQALALLAQPENAGRRYCLREDCEAFLTALGFASGDPIQAFNKFPQRGFVMGSKPRSGQYMLAYPFVADKTHLLKRTGAAISGDRDAAIEVVKSYWRKTLVDVPAEAWQLGHLDPTKGDASESNLAWQPPIQAKYRDRFKWDLMFFKMWPTGAELCARVDEYYSEAEQRALLAALKARYE